MLQEGCCAAALCVRTPSCQSHPLLGHFRTGPQVWLWMALSAHRVVGSLQGIPTGNMSEPLSLAGSGGRNTGTAPSQHGGRGPDCTSLRVTDLKGRERERNAALSSGAHLKCPAELGLGQAKLRSLNLLTPRHISRKLDWRSSSRDTNQELLWEVNLPHCSSTHCVTQCPEL